MALNNQRNFVVAAVILLAAAVGAAAWIHNSGSRPLAAPIAFTDASQGAVTTGDGYYPLTARPAFIRTQEAAYPTADQTAAADQAPSEPQYAEGPDAGGTYTEGSRPVYRTYREYHHGRSKKHSVEIVAGTAAAGAAIGAIAGGGKGAAIGGISGAGAGFAYDRLTSSH